MSYLEECVRRNLENVNRKIEGGKGTWPEPGYIKDDDWAHLVGESYALRSVLRDAGLEV